MSKRPELLRRYTVLNEAGETHLKLDPTGRCVALKGGIGKSVSCSIYAHRPSPCRRVEAGSALCHMYREAHGLE